jgi:hypothetical protein
MLKRTLTSVICDNSPFKSGNKRQLKMSKQAFRIGGNVSCADVGPGLDFPALVDDIVRRLSERKNTSTYIIPFAFLEGEEERKSIDECEWDDECSEKYPAGSNKSLVVCSNSKWVNNFLPN